MNVLDTLASEASTPHQQASPRHRPLSRRGNWTVASGLLATGVLVTACSGSGGSEPNESADLGETSQALAIASQTLMASVPSPGQNWFRPAMTASLGWSGNIEVVRAMNMGLLEHLYWAPGLSEWAKTATFGYNPQGSGAGTAINDPALCVYAPDSYMQVVVNQGTGRLLHYWRDNANQTWTREVEFSQNCTGSPALINNRLIPTNLEVVVREGTHLKHIWRDANYAWQDETPFATGQTVVGDPSFVQAADGRFHVIAPIQEGSRTSMGHWIRDLQYAWSYFGSFANQTVWDGRGSALAANYRNNTISAMVALTLDGCPLALYEFDGTQWRDDGHLDGNGAYPTAALMHPAAMTLGDNELHVGLFNAKSWKHEHWRIVK